MISGNILVLQQWDGKGFEKIAGDGLRYDFINHFVKFILFGQRKMHVRNYKFKSTKFIHTHTHSVLVHVGMTVILKNLYDYN